MVGKSEKRPILVPVDFSPSSEAALLQACDLAECLKQHLIVLHVVHNPAEIEGYYAKIAKKKQLTRMEDLAAEMLDEFLKKVINDHPGKKMLKELDSMLVTGIPVTRILQVVEKTKPGMVIMGSQGHTGLKHILLGSKAEQIVHLCPVPVMIVKTKSKS